MKVMAKMKRLQCFLAAVFLGVLLWGCSSSTVYTTQWGGVSFTVDKASCEISDGNHVYRYDFEGSPSRYGIILTYPNGSSYSCGGSGGSWSADWSDGYDPDSYADGDTLSTVVLEAMEGSSVRLPLGKIAVFLLLLAAGVFYIASPRSAWYLELGWRLKDAEPSSAALAANRAGGVLLLIIAIAVLIFA